MKKHICNGSGRQLSVYIIILYLYEDLDVVYWLLINGLNFLLTTDFWPKILVTTDFCDVEFNN